MATFAAFLSLSSPPPPPPPPLTSSLPLSRLSSISFPLRRPNQYSVKSCTRKTLVRASSASSYDEFNSNNENSRSKKSVLSSLIQEIEPLDVSLIQKDVPPTTLDAMKRTISGMLGLLPSDQFQVSIEALWEPLSKLLVSSMMTGYTLRNAEYRLSLERNLDIYEESNYKLKTGDSRFDLRPSVQDELLKSEEISDNASDVPGLEQISPETQQYILKLQSRLSSVKKELHEVKRKNAALQMQQFVGEEKNDLLDYLRSLEPEKVVELSEPTSPELKERIHSVVHGLLATLSPKMQSKAPPHLLENPLMGTVNTGIEEDCNDLVENTSLQFHPLISLSRDYLARLLFWCMLLGHYFRGLEYRLELMELLALPSDRENDGSGGDQVGPELS